MNKAACIAYASRCRLAFAESSERAAKYAVAFGSESDAFIAETREMARANDAAQEWDKLAAMHPQTRSKLFRDQSLPSEIFGFGAAPVAKEQELAAATSAAWAAEAKAQRAFERADNTYAVDDPRLAKARAKLDAARAASRAAIKAESDHLRQREARAILADEGPRLVSRLMECLMGEDAPAEGTDIYADDFPLETNDPWLLRAIAILKSKVPLDPAEVPKLCEFLIGMCNGATPEPRDADIYARTTLDGDAYVLRAAQVLTEAAAALTK
jgi:hypothetical protein